MATQRDVQSDLSPRKVAERLKEEGKQRLEHGKTSAADQVEHVASALRSAGGEFGDHSTLGGYAYQLADSIGRFGTRLREGSVEELASDLQAAARRNPTAFVLGGLALGVLVARIVKASAPESDTNDYEGEYGGDLTAGASSAGDTYRSSGVVTEAPTVDVTSSDYPGTTGSTNRFGG